MYPMRQTVVHEKWDNPNSDLDDNYMLRSMSRAGLYALNLIAAATLLFGPLGANTLDAITSDTIHLQTAKNIASEVMKALYPTDTNTRMYVIQHK